MRNLFTMTLSVIMMYSSILLMIVTWDDIVKYLITDSNYVASGIGIFIFVLVLVLLIFISGIIAIEDSKDEESEA